MCGYNRIHAKHIKKWFLQKPTQLYIDDGTKSALDTDHHRRRQSHMIGISEFSPFQWRHNGHDGVSNHQPRHFLTQPFSQAQIQENTKAPRHWPLCGEFTGPRTNGH